MKDRGNPGTTRRMFLQLSARVAAFGAVAGTQVACADDSDGGSTAPADVSNPPADVTDADAGDIDATSPDVSDADVAVDVGPVSTADPANITKGPFSNVVGADQVVVRVETSVADGLVFTLIAPDGSRIAGVPTLDTSYIQLEWPPAGLTAPNPDVPGDYTIQDVVFTDLVAGERYEYELSGAEGTTPVTGSFVAPPTAGSAFRVAWVADTMTPASADTAAIVTASEPDLILHGGDIQYMSNPLDTWTGYFLAFGDAFRGASVHHAVGNHEYEEYEEFTELYLRLFSQQGESGGEHYHAFGFGGFRFIVANSEAEGFATDGDEQMAWLRQELAAATEAGQRCIVAFHRPFYSFGHYAPNLEKRAFLHPLFVEHDVALVLTGHNHSYERFLVDGVTYIVDGGGGALLYNVDEHLAEIEAERPDEIALREAAEKTYGALVLDFDENGAITGVRTNVAGETTDTFSIAPLG